MSERQSWWRICQPAQAQHQVIAEKMCWTSQMNPFAADAAGQKSNVLSAVCHN